MLIRCYRDAIVFVQVFVAGLQRATQIFRALSGKRRSTSAMRLRRNDRYSSRLVFQSSSPTTRTSRCACRRFKEKSLVI